MIYICFLILTITAAIGVVLIYRLTVKIKCYINTTKLSPFIYAVVDAKSDKIIIASDTIIAPNQSFIDDILPKLIDDITYAKIIDAIAKADVFRFTGRTSKDNAIQRIDVFIDKNGVLHIWAIDENININKNEYFLDLLSKYRLSSFNLLNILNSIPIPLWQKDKGGNTIFANSQYRSLQIKDPITNTIQLENGNSLSITTIHSLDSSIYFAQDLSGTELLENKAHQVQSIVDGLMEHNIIPTLVLSSDLKALCFNRAFLELFSFKDSEIYANMSYKILFDLLIEKHKLHQLSGFKDKHMVDISSNNHTFVDLWHLSNGMTIKVAITSNSKGIIIITYQDITMNLEHLHSANRAKAMFVEISSMLEYPVIIIAQNGAIIFMTDSFIEVFLKNKCFIPLYIKDLLTIDNMQLDHQDLSIIIAIFAKALHRIDQKDFTFSHNNNKYILKTKYIHALGVNAVFEKR